MLSNRVKNLQESATLKINATVNRMKQEGQSVYNLTAGEPDFPPPEAAKKAVIEAVEKNLSKYTPTPGLLELRDWIAKKTNEVQPALSHQPWKASNVIVTNGGKQAIFDCVLALIDRGDEVIIPAPFWLSYPEMVKAAEGTVKVIETSFELSYKMTAKQLEQAINPQTKLVILNSPSNPTGALYTEQEQKELGDVLARFPKVWVLSDEIYDRIDFEPGTWKSFLQVNPGLRERTITVNGLSKSGSMTGWRIGWSVTPDSLTPALIALQGHSTSGICSLAQAAAIATLKLPEGWFEHQRRQYLHRRDLTLEILRKSTKMKVLVAQGAFYLFIDVKAALREKENADGFAERVLRDIQVAVVSGVDFGAPTSVRISFATDEATLREACSRLVSYCN